MLTVKKEDEPKDMVKKVEEVLGCMPQISIECTGVQSSIQTAIYASLFTFNFIHYIGKGNYTFICSNTDYTLFCFYHLNLCLCRVLRCIEI